jgi:DNA-binding XRE family transcriptional regulator
MAKKRTTKATIPCTRLELAGIRYAIIPESLFEDLCRRAKVSPVAAETSAASLSTELAEDTLSLAEKLVRRRQSVGLSQAELARRAGVRPETLNRIERGRTAPDFATIRKLVVAIDAAVRAASDSTIGSD